MIVMEYQHIPVMLEEVLELLRPGRGEFWVDGTTGGGGHGERILDSIGDEGLLIAVDLDASALEASRARLGARDNVRFIQGNFRDLAELLRGIGIRRINGILFDLGVSSHQLDEKDRGFSFMHDGPVDMRFDIRQPVRAGELVNTLPVEELARILREYGQERWARKIAARIVRYRESKRIENTKELARIIESAVPPWERKRRIHPATRSFQSLRVATNDEIASLRQGLSSAIETLIPGGRIAVLSYESLSDSIVKAAFRECAGQCKCPPGLPECVCNPQKKLRILTPRAIRPGEAEVARNVRARSARLRAAEKL
jgi:16S rRNA (cytosine1402-N4)-methyltransferase